METVKKMAIGTGIALTGVCGIVLLGGGKIVSGTLLVVLTFVMLLPFWRRWVPLWARVGLVCVLFALVIWNISTTELPAPVNEMEVGGCIEEGRTAPSTGFKFLDQVMLIVNSFIAQAEPS